MAPSMPTPADAGNDETGAADADASHPDGRPDDLLVIAIRCPRTIYQPITLFNHL
jgi:hypothetical protein